LLTEIDRELKPRGPEGLHEAYSDSFKSHSAFEWLVAFYLPDVYGLLTVGPIDRDQILSQNGPYVRFAQAVLAVLEIDVRGDLYSRESILRAIRGRFPDRAREKIRRKADQLNDFSFWRNGLLRKEMGLPPSDYIPAEPQPGFYMVPRERTDGQN